MEAFQLWEAVIPRAHVVEIAAMMMWLHSDPYSRFAGQSGFGLGNWAEALKTLQPAVNKCQEYVGTKLQINFERSGCRRQLPNGEARLMLHQDQVALNTLDPNTKCAVLWVPLCDIDDCTPSLDVCPLRMHSFIEHCFDENRYSVAKNDPGVALVTVTRMSMGDVLYIHPTTLHRSSVRPWHTKTRLSLDLRLFPL